MVPNGWGRGVERGPLLQTNALSASSVHPVLKTQSHRKKCEKRKKTEL